MAEEYINEMYKVRVYLTNEKKSDTITRLWQQKNQWYLDLVKERRERIGSPPKQDVPDSRSPRPLPNSTAHEIGWLIEKPEFNVDPLQLHYLKLPMEHPPPGWYPKGSCCYSHICPWNPIACYCLSSRPKLRRQYIYPPCNCPFFPC